MSKIKDSLKFIPYGDQALLINVDDEDILEANEIVIRLTHLLQIMKLDGITEMVPATNSITVLFDTFKVSVEQLIDTLNIQLNFDNKDLSIENKWIELPICYDAEYALDMDIVCLQTGLSPTEVIKSHLETSFHVMMTGFMPGFFYLGQLPEKLTIERKASPRKKVQNGSVGLAGRQTGIYSTDSPGGWQIIGKSINLLDKILHQNFQINLGDRVKFFEVTKSEFHKISLS